MLDFLACVPDDRKSFIVTVAKAYMDGIGTGLQLSRQKERVGK